MSLELVGTHVRAVRCRLGCAGGRDRGAVLSLRHRGGVEYVADALVGPRGREPLATRPGDSGTLWVVDKGGGRGRKAHEVEPLRCSGAGT